MTFITYYSGASTVKYKYIKMFKQKLLFIIVAYCMLVDSQQQATIIFSGKIFTTKCVLLRQLTYSNHCLVHVFRNAFLAECPLLGTVRVTRMNGFKMALSIRCNVKSVFRYITKNNCARISFKAQQSTVTTVRKSSLFAVLLFTKLTALQRICVLILLQLLLPQSVSQSVQFTVTI